MGSHTFTYAYRVFDGSLEAGGVEEAADALNDPVFTVPGSVPFTGIIDISDPSIAVESVKLAEDGSGDMIVRLYESMGGAREARVTPLIPFGEARCCSLEEEPGEAVPEKDGALKLSFRPFEIISLRLTRPGRKEG